MSSAWETAYSAKTSDERSWTQDVPVESLRFVDAMSLDRSMPVIDVGGGSSLMVDELLSRGFTDVTLLDIAQSAIDETRARLDTAHPGATSDRRVTTVVSDIALWQPTRSYALWHDRAVFHFLVDGDDRAAYVGKASAHVVPGGHLLIATFAPDGPETCSGLPVMRWSADVLAAQFADAFDAVASERTEHRTPWGSVQPFTWLHLVRRR